MTGVQTCALPIYLAGAVLKNYSLGTIGNTVAGLVGGGIGGQLLGGLLGSGLLSQIAGGGVGGGVLMVVVGLVRQMMNKNG